MSETPSSAIGASGSAEAPDAPHRAPPAASADSVGIAAAYRLDGQRVSPGTFYRAACDPRRSVVVEACAGAGKTWMLVSRILRALLDGAAPHEILAITFTRKAAGEMRERLDQWLLAYARAGDAERRAALCERGCTDSEARALEPALATLYERLLDGSRGVEIRTFHGWFGQMLRAAPLSLLEPLGLHADAALLEDRSELQSAYTRDFLASVAADPALRADHAAAVRAHGRHTLAQWLEAALDQRIELERADAAGVLEASVPSAAQCFPDFAAFAAPAQALRAPECLALFRTLAQALGASAKRTPQRAAAEIEAGLALEDDAQALDALRRALFTEQGSPRSHLGAPPSLPAACEWLVRAGDAMAQQTAHEVHLRLVRLARAFLASYRRLKRDRGLADMADLESCAERLLSDADLAGWVHERLDARVRHLLIDEFQDTSPLQWRALHAWLSGYAGAGGGASGRRPLALFVVGDPKQSIYRFRRADPRVFAQAKRFVVEALDGAHLACDHTRRNAPAVIDALNAVFARAQAEGEFADFRPHTTGARAAYAEVRLLAAVPRPPAAARNAPQGGWRDSLAVPRVEAEDALRLVEARQVAARVEALLGQPGWSPRDVHVLCRRRAPLIHVAQALRERGIPHATPEQRDLLAAPEVRDLLALLDVLVSPTHALSLAQALKSPIFGASDDDLIALAEAAPTTAGWWSTLCTGVVTPSWADVASPLGRARALLPAWAQAARALPPHDLLDRVLHEGDLPARYAAALPPAQRAPALQAIDALLAEALHLDGGRSSTPYSFVRALRRQAVRLPPPSPTDAVQLLTIHGAKGLEARAVFLVDTRPQAPAAQAATLAIDWPAESLHPRSVAFIASEARCPPSLREAMAEEFAGRAREEMNALYVAMTRAREQLALSATEPHRASPGPSAWDRVAASGVAVIDPVDPVAAHGAGAEARPANDRPRAHAPFASAGPGESVPPPTASATHDAPAVLLELPPLPAHALPGARAASGVDDRAAALGRAVHKLLERLPAREALGAEAARAAAEHGLPADTAAQVAAWVEAMTSSPACARFFDPTQFSWAGNEVPLAWHGRVLRIDRLVAMHAAHGGREWWVLDYKLQAAPQRIEAYRAQLAAYREAVQALQPADTVRAAFVTAAGDLFEA